MPWALPAFTQVNRGIRYAYNYNCGTGDGQTAKAKWNRAAQEALTWFDGQGHWSHNANV
jgi:hypothetical protein